jgi:hypothetical protein
MRHASSWPSRVLVNVAPRPLVKPKAKSYMGLCLQLSDTARPFPFQ